MDEQKAPPRARGRRAGRSTTREDILAAARSRFGSLGYDRTRVRDVAGDAGVDVALVHYFFATKDGLFAAVMQLPVNPAEVVAPLLENGVEGLGERLVRRLLAIWDDETNRAGLLAMVQSATSQDQAAATLRQFITRELIGRIASALDADRPELRASLVGSQVVGLILARYVLGLEPLVAADHDTLAGALGPNLQRYLMGDI